ncbi:MAG: glycosyltransferase family 4 protein [Methylococcales bacterium]|nr:glycosyltransferase family 4 protein [Methylococcales bacterium]
MSLNAAILFEPDAYLLSEPKLMGRQAAGNSFLRAAVAGRNEQTLYAYTPHQKSAAVFAKLIQTIESTATAQWIPADRLDLLSQIGTLYLPGPGVDAAAKLRLRAGSAAYSLVGVTHTTASHRAMDAITGLLSAPVMPWDALICTSTAVLETVKRLLNAEIETLRWRFGSDIQITLPQLPVIPLGIHCDDFDFTTDNRAAARKAFNIGDDEIVLVFVGRLSFHAKAHPHAMYLAAQEVAKKTGKKITLLQCGWFGNDAIQASFVNGAAHYAPDVRALFVDGRIPDSARYSWAGADIFISLSDNIQETFGITPIEAMAAGLPVIVSDWNGYKDTIRDGVDGFRIPTFMPPPNLGENFAKAHEIEMVNYDIYCGLICQTISMSMVALVEKLTILVENPDLRQKMGHAGKTRAKTQFDWRGIYAQYQTLYAELQTLRHAAQQNETWQTKLNAAPRSAVNRLDPFYSFGHYPTKLIQPQTIVALHVNNALENYAALIKNPLFNYATHVLPSETVVEKIVAKLNTQPLTLNALSQQSEIDLGETVLAVAVLTKMDLVRLT